jgi:hypothetical protein
MSVVRKFLKLKEICKIQKNNRSHLRVLANKYTTLKNRLKIQILVLTGGGRNIYDSKASMVGQICYHVMYMKHDIPSRHIVLQFLLVEKKECVDSVIVQWTTSDGTVGTTISSNIFWKNWVHNM